MALRYHPDKCDAEDAEERFKEIYRAYEVLFSDEKRTVYDEFGVEGLNDDGWGDAEAWRSVYKKVTEDLIVDYLAKYKGKFAAFKLCIGIMIGLDSRIRGGEERPEGALQSLQGGHEQDLGVSDRL